MDEVKDVEIEEDREDYYSEYIANLDRTMQVIDLLDTPSAKSFIEIQLELNRAREHFPSSSHSLAALVEEVGELSTALLEGEGRDRVRQEAFQVAVMAIRIAEEGDPSFDQKLTETPGLWERCRALFQRRA